MSRFLNVDAWQQAVVSNLAGLGTTVLEFLPNLVGAVLILLVGWALAYFVAVLGRHTLRLAGLDRAARRLGVTSWLDVAGIQLTVSEIFARLLFWLVLLTFVVSSVDTLSVNTVTVAVEGMLAYVPNLIGAALVLLLGVLLARLLGSLVSSAAAAAHLAKARSLGLLVKMLTAILVVIATVDQLGIATAVLVGPLTAAVAAACLSVGLALALGARPIITHILAGHFLKQSLPRDTVIEVNGQRGMVARVGATETLFKNGEQRWSVPNAQLLDRVVIR